MIKRELYMRRIRPFIGGDLIKVLTGLRRSGKSVMLELIRQELIENGVSPDNIISFNFEDMRLSRLRTAEALHAEIMNRYETLSGKVYLFFDEIQEVADWEKCVNSLRVTLDSDIYITGSNARLLSGELATYLGGRYVEFVIYPFSFAEFVEIYRQKFPNADTALCFRQYMKFGGMPYLANLGYEPEPSLQYLTDVFSSVQLKDIVKRNNIRDVDLLERIVEYIVSNVGMTFSASSISKFLKSEHRSVSVETVLNYIKYCCDAFLFCGIRRQDLQSKQILATNEKYYMADHGFREAVFGNNAKDINLVLENIVCMELLRRGYSVCIGKNGDREIDFVCTKNSDRFYVQVTYLLASDDTIRREFGAYEGINDNFPKYVLSLDEFDMSRNGIIHLNLRDFLLNEK